MGFHDRRPRASSVDEKFVNAKYVAFFQSQQWDMLQQIVREFSELWIREQGTGTTLDEYTMTSLRRDGRIEGLRMLLKHIETQANLTVGN